jgi:membrane protease YdiL (CAAX protease family)
MNRVIDMPKSQERSSLPVIACLLLLLGRLLVVNLENPSLVLLAATYLSILVITRPDLGSASLDKAVLPLGVGVFVLLGARLLLAPPVPVRSTVAGVAVSVLAAVAEEALFRQALFTRLQRHGLTFSVIVCAVAFAAVHVPFYGASALPLDLGAGLLFGWQRSDSGTWTVPAATHTLANLLAVLR